ncbi:hypothetical protein AAMO2058_000419300 [Amorphochlora amoebiformis]
MSRSSLRRRQQQKPKPVDMNLRLPKKEEEGQELYCICRQPYDARRFMIGCDNCDGWFHARCVNITVAEADRITHFICPPCKSKRKRNKDSKDRGKKKLTGKSSGRSAMGILYRPPSRKPSQRIKRHELRRAQNMDHVPYEPNFDTSESEEEDENGIPLEDPGWESDDSAECGVSTKDSTLTVDVYAYSTTHKDLGSDLNLTGLVADDRDKALLSHLRRKAFEVECELHRTKSRQQIKLAGLAFARRESMKYFNDLKVNEFSIPKETDIDSQTADSLIRGINNVRALREVREHCIQCGSCGAYIPIVHYDKHLEECGLLKVLTSRAPLKEQLKRKKRKSMGEDIPTTALAYTQELYICGCPLLDPRAETQVAVTRNPVPKRRKMEAENTSAAALVTGFKTEGAKEAVCASTRPRMASTLSENNTNFAGGGVSMLGQALKLESMGVKEERKSDIFTAARSIMNNGKPTLSRIQGNITAETLRPNVTLGAVTPNYIGYCTKLRSQCTDHGGWAALWTAEIEQQTYFYEKRLQLVREEIAYVKRASEERKSEIAHAKRKTETQEAEKRAEQGEHNRVEVAEPNDRAPPSASQPGPAGVNPVQRPSRPIQGGMQGLPVGPGGAGPSAHGQPTHGPQSHGPATHPTHGAATHGPPTHGPATHGPLHGPATHGPPTLGPSNQAPPVQRPYNPQSGMPNNQINMPQSSMQAQQGAPAGPGPVAQQQQMSQWNEQA